MSEPVKVCAVHMCTCARAHTHTQARAKEVAQGWATGRRGGGAYANLGTGHVYLNDFDNIVAYRRSTPWHGMGTELGHARMQSEYGCRPHPSRPGSSPGPSTGAGPSCLTANLEKYATTLNPPPTKPRLPCGEVLQRRSPTDGLEKSCVGREFEDGAAQGYSEELTAAAQARACLLV